MVLLEQLGQPLELLEEHELVHLMEEVQFLQPGVAEEEQPLQRGRHEEGEKRHVLVLASLNFI